MAVKDLTSVKVLFFDVFGTVVDWRTSLGNSLEQAARTAIADNPSLPADLRARAESTDWDALAVEWRQAYYKFTRGVASGAIAPISIQTHFRSSLLDLLAAHLLSGLLTGSQLASLASAWSAMTPWPDSPSGIKALSALGLQTSTLSNGSADLLREMAENGGLAWTHVLSAEDFGSFKPDPRVYRGAVRKVLGEERTGDAAMVAAHLSDLKAAKEQGLRTVYIERDHERGEEAWSIDEVEQAKHQGWVDLWIQDGHGGIDELAKILSETKH